jgi:hypothetical protein
MKASLFAHTVVVSRDKGAKRARNARHFWGMLEQELNASYAGEYRYCWEASASGLARYSGESVTAGNLDIVVDYNAGKELTLKHSRA